MLLAVLFFCLGCATQQKCICPETAKAESKQHIREGYALLYALASQEKDVDGLLKIKKTSPKNQKVIEEIALVNRDILQSLESWAQNDPEKTVSQSGLPDLEMRSRDLIKKKVTWQLLLSGRRESVKMLMMAQHQALIYESCLLKAIQESEHNKERKKKTGEYAARIDRLSIQVADQISLKE